MKALKKDLQFVVKSLKELTKKIETTAKRLNIIEKQMAVKKPTPKPKVKARPAKKRVAGKTVKKTTKKPAIEIVLATIKRTKKGVSTASLKKKTGFDDKKIWNIINRLKKKKMIKSGGRGIYIQA